MEYRPLQESFTPPQSGWQHLHPHEKDNLKSDTTLVALTDDEEQMLVQYRGIPKKQRSIAQKLLVALKEG